MKPKLSGQPGSRNPKANTDEITFNVERDEENGWITASWVAPRGQGGITAQGKDLRELEQNVREAVRCHFEDGKLSGRIRLHFVNDAVLATA
jgi:predicted RNase H-like HicB family nuclease